ncbi:Hypothetical predicted protein, partial [Pelobates cultripes]
MEANLCRPGILSYKCSAVKFQRSHMHCEPEVHCSLFGRAAPCCELACGMSTGAGRSHQQWWGREEQSHGYK